MVEKHKTDEPIGIDYVFTYFKFINIVFAFITTSLTVTSSDKLCFLMFLIFQNKSSWVEIAAKQYQLPHLRGLLE